MAIKPNLKPRSKPKAVVSRLPKHHDERYLGPEPVWLPAMNDSEKHKELCRAFGWYNYFYTVKEMRKHLLEYGINNLGWTPDQQSRFKSLDDTLISMADCSIARMKILGMEFPDHEQWDGSDERFFARIEHYLSYEEKIEESKTPMMSVQQKMAIKLKDLIADIDSYYDEILKESTTESPPDFIKWLRDNNVSQIHATQLLNHYSPLSEEIKEARSKTADKDLKEGYAYLSKQQVTQRIKWYELLFSALNTYSQVKAKTRKARKPRPVSKEKLISKLQYKKEDIELNIVSSNPLDIVGAKTIWIYNTKTRKIGVYHADPAAQVLGIKGTSLVGFDPKLSIAKTLRKPKDQLSLFNKSGKVALRTFVDDIKSTPVVLTGRINGDTVILKTVKGV